MSPKIEDVFHCNSSVIHRRTNCGHLESVGLIIQAVLQNSNGGSQNMPANRRKSQAKATSEINRKFGPLRGTEWLELDHWAFQELPREEYSLFLQILKYHKVPLDTWHVRTKDNRH